MTLLSVFMPYILFFAALLANFILNYIKYMHMFQLGSYHASEQFKWIGGNIGEIIKRHLCALVMLALLIIFGFHSHIGLLSSTAALIFFSLFSLPERAKKKLVFTPRVIRMCVTSTLLYACVVVCAFILGYYFPLVPVIVYPCVQLLAIFMPMLANLINKPIEALINKHYIDDAKRIINELPNLTVIGITGSYGKTSTKFYLNKLLSAKYNVLMTPESYNTTMGVVKTVRGSLNATHEIFICEMGAKGVGEIKEICDIVKPKHSMITSIGAQHLETFKSIDNIIKTKFEIADCIDHGMVFLNFDNDYIRNRKIDKNVVSYGFSAEFEYYADNIAVTSKGTSFTVHHGSEESAEFSTKLIGEHNVQNIVGAIAIANKLGISLNELKMPVRRLEAVPHRMQIIDRGASVIIDDAFNSNPSGAKAALDTLALMDGYKILISPGMVELGEQEYELNKAFGKQAASVCDFVIAVGEKQAVPIVDGLKEAGYPEEKKYVAHDLNDALAKADTLKTGGLKKIILLENDLPDNY